jgi:hypothetical protein
MPSKQLKGELSHNWLDSLSQSWSKRLTTQQHRSELSHVTRFQYSNLMGCNNHLFCSMTCIGSCIGSLHIRYTRPQRSIVVPSIASRGVSSKWRSVNPSASTLLTSERFSGPALTMKSKKNFEIHIKKTLETRLSCFSPRCWH